MSNILNVASKLQELSYVCAVCAYCGLCLVLLLKIFSEIHPKLILFRTNHYHQGDKSRNLGIEKHIEVWPAL